MVRTLYSTALIVGLGYKHCHKSNRLRSYVAKKVEESGVADKSMW